MKLKARLENSALHNFGVSTYKYIEKEVGNLKKYITFIDNYGHDYTSTERSIDPLD